MIPSLLLLVGCPRPDSFTGKPTDTSPVDTGQADSDTGGGESLESGDSETAVPDSETGRETSETDDTGETGEPPPPCDRTRPWVFVDAGVEQTCGIHDDGCAECWGIGEEENSANWDSGGYHWQGEDQPPAESFVMLDMLKDPDDGWFPHTCGVLLDGSAMCWGECSVGQCDVPPGAYIDIGVSDSTTWGIASDGTAVVWGHLAVSPEVTELTEVQLGMYVLTLGADGSTAVWGKTGVPSVYSIPNIPTSAIDVGFFDACALQTDGSPLCWSRDEPDTWATYDLTVEAPAGPFTEICVGSRGSAACVLDSAGSVACWGSDSYPGSFKNYPPDTTFTQITCGYAHACGVTTEGGIECWGYDWHGETLVPT